MGPEVADALNLVFQTRLRDTRFAGPRVWGAGWDFRGLDGQRAFITRGANRTDPTEILVFGKRDLRTISVTHTSGDRYTREASIITSEGWQRPQEAVVDRLEEWVEAADLNQTGVTQFFRLDDSTYFDASQ